MPYDAILLLSFGGPEKSEDVIPFLENVLRGKNVPRERMLEVAEHYYHFGGRSPINQQNRELIAELERELGRHGIKLPIYWGNRNWHPLLEDTLSKMKSDGVKQALAFVTSAYSSYSGCRQYREDIERARQAVGEGAPVVGKIRAFFNHPLFLDAIAARIEEAASEFKGEPVRIIFTAHSIPLSMAATSDYEKQLRETAHLVASRLKGVSTQWEIAYQSRSGPPSQPWLEPDILQRIREIAAERNAPPIVISPFGFLSDHMEVIFDLDEQARELCHSLNLRMVRAATVGTHPDFVAMVRELIEERLDPRVIRRSEGSMGPRTDECAANCCPRPARNASK